MTAKALACSNSEHSFDYFDYYFIAGQLYEPFLTTGLVFVTFSDRTTNQTW